MARESKVRIRSYLRQLDRRIRPDSQLGCKQAGVRAGGRAQRLRYLRRETLLRADYEMLVAGLEGAAELDGTAGAENAPTQHGAGAENAPTQRSAGATRATGKSYGLWMWGAPLGMAPVDTGMRGMSRRDGGPPRRLPCGRPSASRIRSQVERDGPSVTRNAKAIKQSCQPRRGAQVRIAEPHDATRRAEA